jgi:hypothetical protein
MIKTDQIKKIQRFNRCYKTNVFNYAYYIGFGDDHNLKMLSTGTLHMPTHQNPYPH